MQANGRDASAPEEPPLSGQIIWCFRTDADEISIRVGSSPIIGSARARHTSASAPTAMPEGEVAIRQIPLIRTRG
jgi:hypothetical protein